MKKSEIIRKPFGIESVRLRERRPRVTDFAYNKDKDWRKEQILYE